jgi:hypothetical protein
LRATPVAGVTTRSAGSRGAPGPAVGTDTTSTPGAASAARTALAAIATTIALRMPVAGYITPVTAATPLAGVATVTAGEAEVTFATVAA